MVVVRDRDRMDVSISPADTLKPGASNRSRGGDCRLTRNRGRRACTGQHHRRSGSYLARDSSRTRTAASRSRRRVGHGVGIMFDCRRRRDCHQSGGPDASRTFATILPGPTERLRRPTARASPGGLRRVVRRDGRSRHDGRPHTPVRNVQARPGGPRDLRTSLDASCDVEGRSERERRFQRWIAGTGSCGGSGSGRASVDTLRT